MKMVKSLILGSAAGLIAMSGAQAADLPLKAKAVEYVRICSLYGAGFFYIPGTDTCIKLGGYLRADTVLNTNNDIGFAGGVTGARNALSNYYTTRARMDMTVDTRTATELAALAAPTSVSTTRSSSSLGSPLVGRSRSSMRRGRAIRPAAPIPCPVAATTSPA
jgi:Porin subfamily